MKKLTLIFLFISTLATSQVVSVGFDVSNALYGSNVNKPSLDIQAKIASITKNREIGLELEYFKEIEYFSWGLYINNTIKINNFEVVGGIEGIHIIRGNLSSFGYGFNGETRYWITDKIGISAQYNIRRRTDLQLLYYDGRFVKSGFLNLIYKWK